MSRSNMVGGYLVLFLHEDLLSICTSFILAVIIVCARLSVFNHVTASILI